MTDKTKIALHVAELARQCYMNGHEFIMDQGTILCRDTWYCEYIDLGSDRVVEELTQAIHKVSGMGFPDYPS